MSITPDELNIISGVVSSTSIVSMAIYFFRSGNDRLKNLEDMLSEMVKKDELKEKIADTLKPLQENIVDIKKTLDKIISYQIKKD